MSVNYNITTVRFFTNQTSNISSAPVSIPFSNGVFKIFGTWNGATVQLHTSTPVAGTFVAVTDNSGNPITFTQDTQVTVNDIVYGDDMVVVISNAGAATSLTATLQKV